MRKSTFLKKPRTREELEQAYARAYDDDYIDEQYEKNCPYDEEFDKMLDDILK